ncbi:MAG: acyl-CoA dehydrogenase [Rhodospirillaceae bacterium]|jgi:acyl-CoA dehydrogenase|nr:acyl-CoA dehydrogenase [Rhodospirillaceae bacterium]
MDFSLPERGLHYLEQLQAFFDAHILPRNREWHLAVKGNGELDPPFLAELQAEARRQGLWNMAVPDLLDDDPGTRLSHLEYAPLAELMGRVVWSSRVFNCQPPDVPNVFALQAYTTPAQREQWLQPLLEAECRSGFAMTEPDVASSDATNIATRIRRDGNDLIINGHKWYCTGAGHPDCRYVILLGMNDDGEPDEAPSDRTGRHSAVIVPMDASGVTVVRNLEFMGFSEFGAPPAEILFEDVRVPAENILGAYGEGFRVGQVRLAPARVHHCMRAIGHCETLLDLMKARAAERQTFGKRVIEYDAIQQDIALSRIEIETARLMVLKTAWLLDTQGEAGARREISLIKVYVARVYQQIAERAIQFFGAMGGSPDTPIADAFAWARAFRIGDGPDEVHLRQIFRMEPPGQPLAESPFIVRPPLR